MTSSRPATPVRGAVAVVLAAVLLGACSGDRAEVAGSGPGTSAGSTAPAPGPSRQADPSTAPPAGPSPLPTPTLAQTAIAPPGGEGDLEPVPTTAVETLPPVPVDQPAAVSPGLQVRVADLRAVEVTGRGPGQVSGPAVAVTVEVVNSGAEALDVAGLAVSLAYAGTEASPSDAAPADPVTGPVPAGSDVAGTYVFLVPEEQRGEVTLRVGLASQPVVVFTGSATG